MSSFKGHAITIPGQHVNADTAMGWYLGMDALPPEEIAPRFMSGIHTDIAKNVQKGDILVCGRDFGYGKVHMSLFTAMKVFEIKCIVAESFSTQLVQSAMGGGTFLLECPGVLEKVSMGDEIEVDVERATVKNITQGTEIVGKPFPQFMLDVMQAGGQLGYLMRKVAARKAEGANR